MAESACRQNYHEEVEAELNKQISLELYASHVYLTIANHFDQDDVALKGFHKYFSKQSDEEREHGQKMMHYQNRRGGRVVMTGIDNPPAPDNWNSPLKAMQFALFMEKRVNQSLLTLHELGSRHGDAQFCDFLESEFLQEQVESIKELGDYITNIKRVGGEGLGIYMFDRELQS
ncbi:soma ferritin-like [Ischnura elegans]|uniref:soma ferritin-like n=1 Tax=Ischnura elegans TaxID=197161 RepID=UPI001ED89E91|nr:soma ferritin-like [Ischnura elegans]